MHLLLMCLVIVMARITDISLDTVRTVAIVQGRRLFAAILGVLEAGIYIVAVAQVLREIGKHPIYGVAYALGFALGTYLGILVDQWLAFGEQLVTVFTRKSEELVTILRGEGFRVTEFMGKGRDGDVSALFCQVPRRDSPKLAHRVRQLDPACFYVINDVRASSAATLPSSTHGLRA
jgi:uncharacterized protein YebE (UPF0316 family)